MSLTDATESKQPELITNLVYNVVVMKLTGFLQLEQNSRLHVGHKTERGSSTAFDGDDCWITACDDDGLSTGPTEQIVSQLRFGHHSRFLSNSTSET
jgi:hypothetical protein